MTARYIRNTALLAKIESAYGTDSVPVGTSNSMLISAVEINPLNAQNVPRDLVRGFMGGSEQLVGSAYVECSFTVEMSGSGTAGVAPAWGPLLRGCGFAETISTGARVDYTPISSGFESLSLYYYDDGLLHKLLGARGTLDISALVSERPTLRFRFLGLDGGVTTSANPSTVTTAFVTPKVVTDAYTPDLVIGGTYSTGTIGGGTNYVSTGLEAALGNQVQFNPLVGEETVDIVDREITGRVMLNLSAAQEATFSTSVKNNTLSSVGLTHGTAAGNTVVLFGPQAQFINWRKDNRNGRRMIGYDLRFTPSTGGDDFRVAVR